MPLLNKPAWDRAHVLRKCIATTTANMANLSIYLLRKYAGYTEEDDYLHYITHTIHMKAFPMWWPLEDIHVGYKDQKFLSFSLVYSNLFPSSFPQYSRGILLKSMFSRPTHYSPSSIKAFISIHFSIQVGWENEWMAMPTTNFSHSSSIA